MFKFLNNAFSFSTKSYIIEMVKNMKKNICIIIGLLLLFPTIVNAESKEVTLAKCVDGDTARFNIDGKVKSTRFLAIDTPESVHPKKKPEKYGKEASNYTCNQLKKARKIVLEYDDNSTKTDKYDRALAWVFVDGKLLQQLLVREGYAKVTYLYGDYKYTDLLKKEEQKAKSNKLKIWSNKTTKSDESTELTEILKKIAKKILKKLENML